MIKEAMFYEKLEGGKVRCGLCSHRCEILSGKFGICRVRKNQDGKLYTYAYGEVIASHVDPIEKKPLYHFLPGSFSYSIATAGCNFKCSFCQNWEISQALGIGEGRRVKGGGYELKPEEVIREAKKNKCKSISYTYTEPTIFFEYAYDTARLAKEAGLFNVFVTNGYITEEPLKAIRPYLDAANVDLKSFREDFYQEMCNAHLEPVLNSIKTMKRLGIWVEITTLVVTGRNDSEEEFKDIAEFITSVDSGIPWHISRFHPDFKYLEAEPTHVETLKRAKEIGRKAGLKYIHLGNVIES
ncbi:MAG: AmmeMemoRadiSam system radical SAM enzyme [Candidatus Omnitrophica bacterium]|nr:AmmeMemoRadiSam system radical SAM enzyme [Candidatus Omnitrophota bacterium]